MTRTYNFRGSDDLLKNVEEGKKSEFIRDAVESKIRYENFFHEKKLELNYQLIKYYNIKIRNINININQLKDEVSMLENVKENIKIKQEKSIEECNQIKNKINEKIIEEDKKIEENCLKTTIRLLYMSKYDKNIEINYDYLKTIGKFKSRLSYKKLLKEYVDRNVNTDSYINNSKLNMEDVSYIKEAIKEIWAKWIMIWKKKPK